MFNVTVAFEPVRNSPRCMRAPEAAARYDIEGNKWPCERGRGWGRNGHFVPLDRVMILTPT